MATAVDSATCPACKKQAEGDWQDSLFLCDCGALHWKGADASSVEYGVWAFTKDGKGEKVYLPFWKIWALSTIESVGGYGSISMLEDMECDDLIPDSVVQDHVFYIPAYELDPGQLINMSLSFTGMLQSYVPAKPEPGVRCLPCVINPDMIQAVTEFVYRAQQAKTYPLIQQMGYTLDVLSSELLYLPYYQHSDSYAPGY